MAKYLSGEGLSHFMTKIKSWVDNTFLKLSGGTMTGKLTMKAEQNVDNYTSGALDLNNSNIQGVNSIYTKDLSDSSQEGIHFYRDSTHVDSLWAKNGTLYFTPNRQLGTVGASAEVPVLLNAQVGATTNFAMRPYVDQARANRLAFLPADQIIVEQTVDGGQTWTDAGYSDYIKTSIFSGNGATLNIPRIDGSRSELCALRVTITAMKYDVPEGTSETEKYQYWNSSYVKSQERYFNVREWWFWVGSNSDIIGLKIEAASGNASDTWIVYADDSNRLQGWSGSSWVRAGGGATFGGGTTQTGNRWNWRLTFTSKMLDGKTAFTGTSAQNIFQIRCYGDLCWGSSNNMMVKDHLYSWDTAKNATFPASIFPSANNVGSLGTSTSKWASIYSTILYGDVSGGLRPTTVRPTNANTTGYSARLNYFLASNFMTTNKPSSGNGHILDMEWDDNGKWHGQVAVPAFSSGHIEWRTENGGTWTTWRKLFDDRDVIPAANGGTGQTSLVNSANALINALSTGSSDPGDNDYYVSQYVNGGTTTTTFHRRPMSALWNYIKGKISSILGLTAAQYGGNAATATSAGNVTGTVAIANGGTGKTTAAEAWTALGGGAIGKKSTLAASDIPSLAISKVTNLQTSLDGKAPLASPDFTGTPTAPTAATGTNTTQVATTAFVKDAMDNLTVYSEDIEYGTGTVADALDEMSQTVHNLPTKAFTKVNVGTTTIVADSADDALTLAAGTNVTLTPNAANDSITISVANTSGYSLDDDIAGRANDYGPLYFSEDAGDTVVVDGPLPVAYGGTGVATIAALKTALGLEDSGWQTLPLGSVFKSYGTNYTPMYRKVNGVVEVTGGVSPNTAQTLGETALTIGTLPTGFRPASNRNVQVICQASGRKLWLMRIDSSGVVSAQRMRDMGSTSYQSMATNEWMLFSATFLAG